MLGRGEEVSAKDIDVSPPEGGVVMLPCGADDFKDFISGLLGKPQTIDRQIDGPFELDRDDVQNLHALIEQRVLSQNDGALMQFTARILYDDNSSVLLNSIDDFVSYNEVKPLISESLVLTWVFLLKFRGRSVPEKQTIDIRFGSNHNFFVGVRVGIISPEMYPAGRGNDMSFRVSHTDRSWGADIDALLTGSLEKLRENESKIRTFVSDNSIFVVVAVFLICLGVSIWGVVESANNIANSYSTAWSRLGPEPPDTAMLHYISNAISVGAWTRFGLYGAFFVIVAVIVSFVFAGIAGTLAERRQPSFILLTKEAEKAHEKNKSSLRNNWIKLAFTAVMSGLAGAAGKHIFLLITNFGGG